MSKTIVVVGVTGLQGSSVAETFLTLPDWRVRGITRNPSSEAAQALAAKGVEIVKADLDDKDSLIPAFEGASAIFANTDFFALLFKAAAPGGSPSGRAPKERAFDLEVAQNVNIAAAAASPAVIKTLERFVLSSLSDATKWSGGKYTTVYHYDSKAEAIRIIQAEFPEVAARMSTLQVGHYVTNWKAFHLMAPQKQPDGSFLTIRPTGPNAKFPFVVTQRDTGPYVKALVDLPAGKDVLGVSQSLTFPEWMTIWGKVLGVKAGFKQVSWEEFFGTVPEPLKSELQDAWKYFEDFGHTGGDPNVLTPEQLGVKVPLTTMEEYIRSEDWSSVLNS
ncbi:putative -like family protein [Phaeoacremonium minimum UCRPA7]|uniref:Putative-like family protein n=1 Tax=Phaeoacremonium minimum (strain UCR-PA7) TaxID=1286976 RepID=R8BL89_PHAM7|nr:putative -like family protein [Phaeoacremonium minimum UCRPA7]EOO00128.1 putative -like family protein [Phaeoacremonium minimum UCRPA7]